MTALIKYPTDPWIFIEKVKNHQIFWIIALPLQNMYKDGPRHVFSIFITSTAKKKFIQLSCCTDLTFFISWILLNVWLSVYAIKLLKLFVCICVYCHIKACCALFQKVNESGMEDNSPLPPPVSSLQEKPGRVPRVETPVDSMLKDMATIIFCTFLLAGWVAFIITYPKVNTLNLFIEVSFSLTVTLRLNDFPSWMLWLIKC